MQHSFSRGESYGFPAVGMRPLEGFGLGGVDIFFVISGFIMAYSQSRAPKTPVEFILGRFVRIVPLYWSWMALIAALIYLVPSVFRTLQIDFEHIAFSTLFLSQLVLNEPPFIDLGWTLEYEMLFYVTFALTLLLGNGLAQLLALGTVMLGFALVFGQWIVVEFLLGVAAFLLLAQARGLGVVLILAGIAGFAVMHGLFAEMHRLWTWGVTAFFLVLGLSEMRGRHARALSYLGDASYSTYLVQVASIPLFYKVASVLLAPKSGVLSWRGGDVVSLGDLLIPVSIAFSLVAGVLLHEVVEKPVTMVARSLLLPPKNASARK